MIVYSIKSVVSFNEAEKYYNKVIQFCGESPKVVLVGNMCDISIDERGVSTEQGKALAKKWGAPFFETSAKNDINITPSFEAVLKLLVPGASTEGGCCRIA